MSSPKVLVGACLASALVGGLIGGFTLSTLGSSPASRAVADEVTTEGAKQVDGKELVRLEARIAELQGQVSKLEQRRRSREALEEYARQLNSSGGAKNGEAKNGEEPARPSPPADAEDPVFELAVRSVLDRVEWERNEEERLTRAQQRSERAERQTALLSERLALTDEQATRVSTALSRQMERFRALREGQSPEGRERPQTRSEWRERTQKIRDETEGELGEILDERQMKDYRAFAEEEGLGPGRWGRRGGQLRSPPAPE